MFGLGMGEIMVILVVALLVLGPQKLPDAAKQIGKAIRELRRHTQNLQETIEQDEHIGGTVRELKQALNEPIMVKPRVTIPPPAETEKPIAQNAPAAPVTGGEAAAAAVAVASETVAAAAATPSPAAEPSATAAPAAAAEKPATADKAAAEPKLAVSASPEPTHHG